MKPLITKGWDGNILKEYEIGNLPLLMGNMTRGCNYKCIYCHTDAGEKESDELTADEWIPILDESAESGSEVFWIGGRGEPLRDEALEPVIRHADDLGITTILNTNGSMITKKWADFFYSHNVSPEVKIISFDEAVYDYMAGIKGMFPSLKKGLRNLIDAGYGTILEETDDARITRIGGLTLLAKPAYESIPKVIRYCCDNNFSPVISDVVASGRVVKNRNLEKLMLSGEEKKHVLEIAEEIMGYPLSKGAEECLIQYGMVVQNNGDVIVDRYGMSCDVCDYKGRRVIGNVRDISLKDGWKIIKKEREKYREQLKAAYQEFKQCPDCLASCPMALQSRKDYFKS